MRSEHVPESAHFPRSRSAAWRDDSIIVLTELGFTTTEARVYAHVLRSAPAAPSALATALHLPIGAVDAAVANLVEQSFMRIDDDTSTCRAVPSEELLHLCQVRFDERHRRAERALTRIDRNLQDDQIYHIESVDAVYERAQSMMRRARHALFIDAYPGPFYVVRPDVEAAVARGVQVTIKVYGGDLAIPGARVIADCRGSLLVDHAWGHWLNVSADFDEFMLACVSTEGDDVIQAVWSRSPLLAWYYRGGLWSELVVDELCAILDSGAPDDEAFARMRARLVEHRAQMETVAYGKPDMDGPV